MCTNISSQHTRSTKHCNFQSSIGCTSTRSSFICSSFRDTWYYWSRSCGEWFDDEWVELTGRARDETGGGEHGEEERCYYGGCRRGCRLLWQLHTLVPTSTQLTNTQTTPTSYTSTRRYYCVFDCLSVRRLLVSQLSSTTTSSSFKCKDGIHE